MSTRQSKQIETVCRDIENRWKVEDEDPIAPAFTVEPGIKIDFPDLCDEIDIFKMLYNR